MYVYVNALLHKILIKFNLKKFFLIKNTCE